MEASLAGGRHESQRCKPLLSALLPFRARFAFSLLYRVKDNHDLHLKSAATMLVWTLETGFDTALPTNKLLGSIGFSEVTPVMYGQSAGSRVVYSQS
jgi:hypothetical protein